MGTINFIHPAFRPQVVSDKPSRDGYDVSNLISVQNYMPPKGFMVESFIRPPVCIYFTFPCNIEINRIILHGAVSSQKSTGYELFCFSALRKAETCSQRWDPAPGSPAPTVAAFDSYAFTPLGRLWQEQQTEYADVVCFTNPSFRGISPFSVLSPMPSKLFEQRTVDVDMRRQHAQNLKSVSHLLVRITRTADGQVPALRWIEVWGQPSVSSCREDREQVLSAYNSVMGRRRTPAPPAHLPTTQTKHNPGPTRPAEHLDTTVDAPAEFCDPITCNIMTQPMLLPCGNSIDLSTLDKFNDEQAKLGRAPADPFTWVPYTHLVKPVPNTKLKVRIDHYLLTNPAVMAARTLGRSVDLRTVDRRAGENAAQTSVLLQEQPKQDRRVGVRPAQNHTLPSQPAVNTMRTLQHYSPASVTPTQKPQHYSPPSVTPTQKPQHYSPPSVTPTQKPQHYSPASVTPTQKPQHYSPASVTPTQKPTGYPTTVNNPTKPAAMSTFPRPPLASLDRSLALVLAGRPSYQTTAPVTSPRTSDLSPNGSTPSYAPPVTPALTLPMPSNGATTPSYTHTSSTLRRIVPKRPLLDQGANLMTPVAKSPRTNTMGGLSINTMGGSSTHVMGGSSTHVMGGSSTHAMGELSTSPVIDLTSDSDPEEVTPFSKTSPVCLPPQSVIRRNPAVSHEKIVTQSLDNALDKTLSAFPSYHNSGPQSPISGSASSSLSAPTQPKLECVFCTLYREVGVMYQLGCRDVACRDCLSTRRKTGELLCYKCERTTPTRDIAKLHT